MSLKKQSCGSYWNKFIVKGGLTSGPFLPFDYYLRVLGFERFLFLGYLLESLEKPHRSLVCIEGRVSASRINALYKQCVSRRIA
ncbi:hypothetical protein D3C77_436650 [compost metagenome]